MVAFTPCAHKLPHAVGEVAANCEVTCTEPSTQVGFSLSEVPFGCLFEPHLRWACGQATFDVSLAAYFEPRLWWLEYAASQEFFFVLLIWPSRATSVVGI